MKPTSKLSCATNPIERDGRRVTERAAKDPKSALSPAQGRRTVVPNIRSRTDQKDRA
jgi:hypothetical protein